MNSSWCSYAAAIAAWLLLGQSCAPTAAAAAAVAVADATQQQKTALGWLYLVSSLAAEPAVQQGASSMSNNEDMPAPMAAAADAPLGTADALIREAFIQGVLQGLQQAAAPMLQMLADAPLPTTAAPALATGVTATTVEKDADDYDYIDFQNGSRIKYELDEPQPINDTLPTKNLHKMPTQPDQGSPPRRHYQPSYPYANLGPRPQLYYHHIG